MSNPILSGFRNHSNQQNQQSQNNQSNSLFGLMSKIKNSPNPNQAAQDLLTNDPQFNGMVDYINQNGGSAQAAFYNLARQKGQNPDTIVNTLKQFFGS